jgi:hypothetical protein
MTNSNVEKVLQLLEAVISGQLTAEAALGGWPAVDSERDKLITSAWHTLAHYAADADIRSKDQEYAGYQLNLLREHAKEIRAKYSKA